MESKKPVLMTTVADAAKMFGLSKYVVRKLARQGKISAIRTEGRIFVNVMGLRDYLADSYLSDEML